MRRLTIAIALLACLAVGAWWTAKPRTAHEALGWCVQRRGQEAKFVRCIPGLRSRPMVVGYTGQPIDVMPGDWPLGTCPSAADYVVRSAFPSAGALMCLDTKPGDTNVRRY